MRLASLLVALSIAAASPAHAQPAPQPDESKSEASALALSIAGTLGSAGLLGAGVASAGNGHVAMLGVGALASVVGPSIGHIYAGEYLTAGLVTRVVGMAAFALGASVIVNCDDEGCDTVPGTLMLVGAGVYLAGAIYDIATAPRAARRWNAKHHVWVMPTVVGPTTHATIGLGFSATF